MLVHHEPGTTRDYVSEYISIQGIPLEFVDTAGIRNSIDMLETMGMELTQEQLQRADKIITVFDNSRHFDEEDEGVLHIASSLAGNKKAGVVPIANKCDLPAKLDRARIESSLGQPLCSISARDREGLDALNSRFVQGFDTVYKPMKPVVFRERQRIFLEKAGAVITKGEGSTRLFSHKTVAALKHNLSACLSGQCVH
jgi:tRNA modification GTPase